MRASLWQCVEIVIHSPRTFQNVTQCLVLLICCVHLRSEVMVTPRYFSESTSCFKEDVVQMINVLQLVPFLEIVRTLHLSVLRTIIQFLAQSPTMSRSFLRSCACCWLLIVMLEIPSSANSQIFYASRLGTSH